jgi:hypothetical protein
MDQPSPAPPTPRPWLLWGLSVLVMYGVATGLRDFVRKSQVYFEQYGATNLPRPVELTLEIGPYLWIAVTAVAVEGLRRILKKDRAAALTWCLGSVLAFVALTGAMACSLYRPLFQMTETLSNK